MPDVGAALDPRAGAAAPAAWDGGAVVRRACERAARRELSPASWASASSIVRWLDDVPREARSEVRVEARANEASQVPKSAPAAKTEVPEVNEASPPLVDPIDALRGWLRAGRTLGKDALSYYRDKLARRARC